VTEKGKEERPYRCCLFFHSGSYDKVYQGLSIANVVIAKGGEAHLHFSYGALKRLVKGNTDTFVIDGEPAPFREEIEGHINRGTVDRISDLIRMGKQFGRLKLYTCSSSMAVLNIARDELIDDVDATTGMVNFLDLVKEADLTLYI